MATLSVGLWKPYSAIAAAQTGDTLEVRADSYTTRYVSTNKNIAQQGVSRMVSMVSTGLIPNSKAIFITSGNITINNFEFPVLKWPHSTASEFAMKVAILLSMVVIFTTTKIVCLAGQGWMAPSRIITASSPITAVAMDTHNLYIGAIPTPTINNSCFHNASEGHAVTSRALNTTITNSRIDDLNGTVSYSIDLPNSGNAVIQNNVIQQGSTSHNPVIISIGGEDILNLSTRLLMTSNTILNDLACASSRTVKNSTTTMAQITNRKFSGLTSSQITSGHSITASTTC